MNACSCSTPPARRVSVVMPASGRSARRARIISFARDDGLAGAGRADQHDRPGRRPVGQRGKGEHFVERAGRAPSPGRRSRSWRRSRREPLGEVGGHAVIAEIAAKRTAGGPRSRPHSGFAVAVGPAVLVGAVVAPAGRRLSSSRSGVSSAAVTCTEAPGVSWWVATMMASRPMSLRTSDMASAMDAGGVGFQAHDDAVPR